MTSLMLFYRPEASSVPLPLEVVVPLVPVFVHFLVLELACGHPIHMAGFQVVPFPTGQETKQPMLRETVFVYIN